MVTMKDWEEAGDFNSAAKPGDAVDKKIVDTFIDSMPPVVLERGFVQAGEPYSHEYDILSNRWKPTFATFKRDNQGKWIYCGRCFVGCVTEPPRSCKE